MQKLGPIITFLVIRKFPFLKDFTNIYHFILEKNCTWVNQDLESSLRIDDTNRILFVEENKLPKKNVKSILNFFESPDSLCTTFVLKSRKSTLEISKVEG